jgi:hypothetical protein
MTGKSSVEKNANQPEKNSIDQAHQEAEKDIEKDPELNPGTEPEADLDEGDLARLEGEE